MNPLLLTILHEDYKQTPYIHRYIHTNVTII
jgi:hypothetical protein